MKRVYVIESSNDGLLDVATTPGKAYEILQAYEEAPGRDLPEEWHFEKRMPLKEGQTFPDYRPRRATRANFVREFRDSRWVALHPSRREAEAGQYDTRYTVTEMNLNEGPAR